MHGLFITGTDTGVGKTRIGTTLAHCLVERGVRVRVRKPVESGCLRGENGLLPQDALALHAAARSAEPLERVCRYCLEAAISPERAAALEGLALNLEQLLAACRAGVSEDDFLLVEGAGGFYSPLAPGVLNADLAAALGLPVLLVAADRLGAINHALLTAQAIERHGLTFAGLVLNAAASVNDIPDILYRDDNRYLWEFADLLESGQVVAGVSVQQVRKYASVMEMLNTLDVPGAGDDANEIWVLSTEFFSDEDPTTSLNQKEGREPPPQPYHSQIFDRRHAATRCAAHSQTRGWRRN